MGKKREGLRVGGPSRAAFTASGQDPPPGTGPTNTEAGVDMVDQDHLVWGPPALSAVCFPAFAL